MSGPRRLIVLSLLFIAAYLDAQQPVGNDLISIFRSIPLPDKWKPTDSLHIFRGEDLYQLIDGGADIYFEYGFSWAGSRRYASPAGNELGLEIYEMRDPESAYGIFSFLAEETGTPVPFGQAGVGGDGFFIYQKDRFVVTLTALDSGSSIDLRTLAGSVERKILPGGRKPELVEVLLRPNFHNTAVMALKGPIGFEQRARLGLGDLFNVRDGAGGIFDSCRTFILRYAGEVACDTMEMHSAEILTHRGGYRELNVRTGRLFQHPRGMLIYVARTGRYLLLTMGEGREKVLRVASMLGKIVLNQR
jgi:hypothetical protein